MNTKPIPGPKGHWLLGRLREFQPDKLGFLQGCWRTYGGIFTFRVANVRAVVVNDLAHVHKLLIDDVDEYQKSRLTKDIFDRVMGNGLLVSDGKEHWRQRRLVQLAFDAKRLLAYGGVAIRHAARAGSSAQ